MKNYITKSLEERNILQTISRNANWSVYILHRISLRKHVIEGTIEGRIEVTGSLGVVLVDSRPERSSSSTGVRPS
jgi:hypothetical protein